MTATTSASSTVTLRFNNAAVIEGADGAGDINLIDALNGKMGHVSSIAIVLNVDQADEPVVPFIPSDDKEGIVINKGDKGADVSAVQSFTIRKGTKVAALINALRRKRGVTFEEIKKLLNMTDGGASSYLYYYPSTIGCTLSTEKVANRGTVYRLSIPDNVKLVEKEA